MFERSYNKGGEPFISAPPIVTQARCVRTEFDVGGHQRRVLIEAEY